MTLHQSVLAFLFAACLIQGAFLGPVIVQLKDGNRRANTILALLLLCFLPMIGEEFVEVSGLTARLPHTVAISITMDFLIAPLLLFYAWSLTEPDRVRTRRDLLHFAPFVLALLVMLPFYLTPAESKPALFERGLPASFKAVIAAKIVVGAAYLTAVIRHLRRFLDADAGRRRDPTVVWLLRAMLGLAGVAVASVAIAMMPIASALPIDSDALGTLFIGGTIYLISFQLMRQPLAQAAAAAPSTLRLVLAPVRPKYETSPLTAEEKRQYHDRLVRHMDQGKPFLDMQLTLEKLAGDVGLRPGYLSQILNERLGMNFYEFVNAYRVREVQTKLADPTRAGGTLLALAHESGFNSKASFNRAFKRVTGLTPSEYVRSNPNGVPFDTPSRLTRSSEATD
jgi:AraC-like DNA-binding protein